MQDWVSNGLDLTVLIYLAELELCGESKSIPNLEKSEEINMNECNVAWRSENNLHLFSRYWKVVEIIRFAVIILVFMCMCFEKKDRCCLLKGFLSWCKILAINMPLWQKGVVWGGVKCRMPNRRFKLFFGIFERFLLEKCMKIAFYF